MSDPDGLDACYQLAGLSVREAAVLIEALSQAKIRFEMEIIEEPPCIEHEGDSGEVEVLITVNACDRESTRRIEVQLFGR